VLSSTLDSFDGDDDRDNGSGKEDSGDLLDDLMEGFEAIAEVK
jgi:hypothetical protein